MEVQRLKASIREETGKNPARRLRGNGLTPAVLYGSKTPSIKLTVQAADLKKMLLTRGSKKFFHLVLDRDGKTEEKLSMVKQFEVHPLTDQLIHADFYEVDMNRKVTVEVPIRIEGTALGVEMGGEMLQHKRSLKISSLPANLPERIVLDVRKLKVGESLKVKDIPAPEGVSFVDGGDVAVIFIAMTRAALKAADEKVGVAAAGPAAAKAKPTDKKKK
jgi:large subunit ribosomal protein L25